MSKKLEEKLLTVDERITSNLEEKRLLEIENARAEKPEVIIEDFDQVPKEHVLTDKCVFEVFNALTKAETDLTGDIISGLFGLNKSKREALKNKLIGKAPFEVDNKYIKFKLYKA